MNKFLRHIGKRIVWLYKLTFEKSYRGTPFRQSVAQSEGHLDRDTGKLFWRMKKLILLLFSIIDIWIGYFYTLYYRIAGYSIIVDTSPYDIFLKYHMPHFKLLERVLSSLVPKPSIGFVLKASPHNIRERKPELNTDEIEKYYQRLSDIISRECPDRYHDIDTCGGEDKTFAEIERIIMFG